MAADGGLHGKGGDGSAGGHQEVPVDAIAAIEAAAEPGEVASDAVIEMLRDLSTGLATAVDSREVLDIVFKTLGRELDLAGATIMVPAKGALEAVAVVASSGPDSVAPLVGYRLESPRTTLQAMQSGHVMVVENLAQQPDVREEGKRILGGFGIDNFAAAPLMVGDRVVGVLLLGRGPGATFSPRDLALTELGASQAALSIDRIRAGQRSQEVTARDRTILRSIGDGLVTIQPDGVVVRWNRAMEEMTGVKEPDAVNRAAADVISLRRADGSELAPEEVPFSAALAERGRVTSPAEGHLLDCGAQGWRPVAVTASPVLEEDLLFGVVAVVRDISRERELDELRESLVSTVSHELRTPLTMVQGFAELLSDESLPDADRAVALEQIAAAARRLETLIKDLLSTASIDAGGLELFEETVLVATLVERSKRAFSPEEAARVHPEIPGELSVRVDPDRMEQVLVNLISNALKYSERGADVAVRGGVADGRVAIEVEDRGIGISADHRSKLFTKFYRAPDERVRHTVGTGLGLYICKHLVELHGGEISVDSTPGEGTVVRLLLPPG